MTNNDDLRERLRDMAEQLLAERKEKNDMAEHLKEAVMRLKESREVSEVKLSDLPEEEWGACKGMWVRREDCGAEAAFEGVILNSDEEDVLVYVPDFGYAVRRWQSELTLLPDYQRAFTSTGGPVKVDPDQWEKTHEMEEEIDRIKAEEEDTALPPKRESNSDRITKIIKLIHELKMPLAAVAIEEDGEARFSFLVHDDGNQQHEKTITQPEYFRGFKITCLTSGQHRE